MPPGHEKKRVLSRFRQGLRCLKDHLVSPVYKKIVQPYYSFLKIGALRAHETRDPELARTVFTDRDLYGTPGFVVTTLQKVIGNALPVAEGEDWEHMRDILDLALNRNAVINKAAPLVMEECDAMLDRWQKSGGPIDVGHEFQEATGRIIARHIFGDGLEAEKADFIVKLAGTAIRELEARDSSGKPSATPYGLGVFKSSIAFKIFGLSHDHPGKVPKSLLQRIKEAGAVLDPFIARRRALASQPEDVMGVLISARKRDGSALSDQEIKDEIFTLIIAGHETTSSTMTFGLDEILKSPRSAEIQDRIRDEFNAVAVKGKISAENVSKLRYTGRTFDEAMRMHPVISTTSRELRRGAGAFGKHDLIKLDVKGIHMREDLWTDPQVFRPERYAEKGCPVKSLIPFGHGKHACPGAAMAKFEGAVFFSKLLARFNIQAVQHIEGEEHFFAMRPKGKLLVTVMERAQQ